MTLISTLVLLFSSVITTNAATNFKDVPTNHWAKKEIDYLVNLGVIKGYKSGVFKPNDSVTNAQVAVMLVRALKLNTNGRPNPKLQDVYSTHYAYKAIATVIDEGIFPKTNKFYPNEPISRESMARALVNAFNLKGTNHVNFIDVPTNYWAYTYITKLAYNNITTGYPDGTFRPKNKVTRAQFSAFLARALNEKFRPLPTVTRGVRWGMTKQQVKNIETAKLLQDYPTDKDGFTALKYKVEKYGYTTHLTYFFENGRLNLISFDFLPDKNSYNTIDEMEALHRLLLNEAVKELGNPYFVSNGYNYQYQQISALWKKDFYEVALIVGDENLYTSARLIYYQK